MSINPDFKPISDYYKSEDKPLSEPGLPLETYWNEPGTMLMANQSKPVTFQTPHETPGFFPTLGEAFSRNNEFMQAGRFISREAEFIHPANDVVPDDFNPRDFKYLQDYPPNFWNFISEGQSPNDITARQQWVSQKVSADEDYNNGSFAAMLIGGLAGFSTSLTSFIPFAQSVKYASIAENVVKGMLEASPGLALQTAAHEGYMQATDAGGNLEDFAINSLRDMAFGVAFIGAGAGLGAAFRGGKLWNTRKMANIAYEGIDVNPVLDPESGEITGYKAQASTGLSVSAAKVDEAQQFVDSAMHEGFLFGIPGVTKLAGNKIIGSPIVRGKSSRFNTIKKFTDLMASHSIITNEQLKGIAKPDSAEDMMSQFNAGALNFNLEYQGHFYEENGIEGGSNFTNAAKALKQRALKGETTTWDDFNYQVIDTTLTQSFNKSKSINAASMLQTKFQQAIYKDLLETKGFDPIILTPRNAAGYFTHNMNTLHLVKYKKEFRDLVSTLIKNQDERINAINDPLEKAQDNLKQLLEHKLSGESYDRSMVNEIKAARSKLKNIQKDIERKARDDESYAILLEDRNFVTMDEADEIRELHKPINEVNILISKKNKEIIKLKNKLSTAKAGASKSVTKETTIANIKKMKEFEEEIAKSEEALHKLKNNLEETTETLHERARNGEINKRLFTQDEHIINFRDPEYWAMFRKPYANDDERIAAAEGLRNIYLNNTPEQVQQAVLSSMMPSLFANPIKKRVVMLPAKDLNDANFILRDVPKVVSAYAKTLGRHITLGKVFKDINVTEGEYGPIGMARILAEEHQKFEREIDNNNKLSPKEKEKENLKLQKDFTDAREFMKAMHNIFMGNTNASAYTLRITRALRSYAVSTKLGGVPLSQIVDMGAIILKHGMWPYLREGLIPAIRAMNGYAKGEAAENFKKNAADAHLALNHVGNGYSLKYYDSGSIGEVPIATHLESALEKVAHVSGNFFGTNLIDNANQRIIATIMQSKIMRQMYEFKEGKLSEGNKLALLQYGLDPIEWADRFINSFEKSTGWKEKTGAYQSKYWEWEDNEAVARMASTLRRGVADTIIQKGLYNSPFWMNNPVASMIFMFHGWSFAAFNRFTVPMMQRLDAQKLWGIVFMLGLGAMTDPLRNFANGKGFDVNENDTWFARAFTSVSNSGILGHTTDILQTFNKMVDGKLLPAMTTRYQGWNKWSVLGPAAGMLEDYATLVKDALTGKITAPDAKRGARLVPLEGAVGLRYLVNHWIDSMGLPEHQKDAAGYIWRQ